MAHAVFLHRTDTIYQDFPSSHYQFPKQYLNSARNCVGDWIIYLEPQKVKNSRGYFAIAKIESIIPDPNHKDMYLALVQEGSYLDFGNKVPLRLRHGSYLEHSLLNAAGHLSGRAQLSVRTITDEDFARIVNQGLTEDCSELSQPQNELHENIASFDHQPPNDRIMRWTSRLSRDQNFRKIVLHAYNETCAITGLRLINGGGKAEAQAAHIKPVRDNGPDIINNGLALSSTVHWMFDRGLIAINDNFEIIISRQVNNPLSIQGMINPCGKIILPQDKRYYPHDAFLSWHRTNCFKS